MNILFVLADQFRHDCLSALGQSVVQTPHLDGLAAAGTLFTRSYCATMACGPARASLFTGYYADTHGMQGNRTTLLPPDLPVLDQPRFAEDVAALRLELDAWHEQQDGRRQ